MAVPTDGHTSEIRCDERKTDGTHSEEPVVTISGKQLEQRPSVEQIQVVNLREVRVPEPPKERAIPSLRQPVEERQECVQLDGKPTVRCREHHALTHAAHFAYERRLFGP